MKKYKIVGLTGQSGAGKSTVAALFEKNNVRVINADLLVQKIYRENSICLKTVSSVFGADIVNPNGVLNRELLAQRAFSSKDNTRLLNSIVHPFVMSCFLDELKNAVSENSDIIVYDAPQLFESNADLICDFIVSVVADEDNRIKRICRRDKITQQRAIMRLNAQLSEDFFRKNSDFIIENNGSFDILKTQFDIIMKKLQIVKG